MNKMFEKIPRDHNGFPVHRKPQRESDELDASTGMLDDFDASPDSSETVAFDEDSSPAYLLGRLECLQTVYRDSMPSGCKSALRKGIGLLQQLVSPTRESRKRFAAGALSQLQESSRPASRSRRGDDEDNPFAPPRQYSPAELQGFAARLKSRPGSYDCNAR